MNDHWERAGRRAGRDLLLRTMFGLIERALGVEIDHAKLADELLRQMEPATGSLSPDDRAAFMRGMRAVIDEVLPRE